MAASLRGASPFMKHLELTTDMETVNRIELGDESIYPDEQVLEGVLGDSYTAYCELLKLFDANQMEYDWRYYHDGKAWLCKVQKKKKTIVWMSAWKGYMQATIYFPRNISMRSTSWISLKHARKRSKRPGIRVNQSPVYLRSAAVRF
jgi:hypothetical protein